MPSPTALFFIGLLVMICITLAVIIGVVLYLILRKKPPAKEPPSTETPSTPKP